MALVDKYGPSLLRVARMYVPTQSAAEEVVAETWLAVVTGLERFEERSSLKTWLFRILTNKAKTRGVRERRTLPFSSFVGDGDEETLRSTPTASPRRRLDARRRAASRRSGCSRARRAGDDRGGDRGAAPEPARRDHAPRRRGPLRRGGVQRSRAFRDQSACTAPPRPGKGAGRVRAVPGEDCMSATSARDSSARRSSSSSPTTSRARWTPALRASFDAHLSGCPHCTHYLEQMRATIRVAGTITAEALPPEFRAGLLEAFRGFRR